jgi:hypothetical protein
MLKPCVTQSAGKIHHRILSDVDWIVVDIARKDGPISLNPDGLWARISSNLFGLAVANRLADDTLEALRRFCVRAWYWNFIRTSDLRTLIEAGYSHVQALQILAHIAGRRGYCPTIEESTAQ